MGPKIIFDHLKKIELSCSDLYAAFHDRLKEKDPHLAKLFKELSEEEILHVKSIEMVENLYLESPESFIEVIEHEDLIYNTLETVERIKKQYIEETESLNPQDMLKIAEDLEALIEGNHGEFESKLKDDNIKSLLKSLSSADKAHLQLLKGYRI